MQRYILTLIHNIPNFPIKKKKNYGLVPNTKYICPVFPVFGMNTLRKFKKPLITTPVFTPTTGRYLTTELCIPTCFTLFLEIFSFT